MENVQRKNSAKKLMYIRYDLSFAEKLSFCSLATMHTQATHFLQQYENGGEKGK
jgi:hypothetical protein